MNLNPKLFDKDLTDGKAGVQQIEARRARTGLAKRKDNWNMSEQSTDQMEKPKKSFLQILLLIIRGLLILILLGSAGYVVFIHNWFNFNGARATPEGTIGSDVMKGIFIAENSNQIPELAEKSIRSSQWMNPMELSIWVFFPWVLLVFAFFFWRGRAIKKLNALLILALLLVIFSLAQTTNIIGTNKNIEKELPTWKKAAQLIEHPSADRYKVTDERSIQGRFTSISFTTLVPKADLNAYYENKGFSNVELYSGRGLCKEDNIISFGQESLEIRVGLSVSFDYLRKDITHEC
mgnify:CR=1 FL=1